MFPTDEEIIEKYGKKDGRDLERMALAKKYCSLLDRPLESTFTYLLKLEERGGH